MSIIQGTSMASAAGGFDVPNAIHLSAASSQYFTRTPGGSGNRRQWTFSTWVRRGALGTNQCLLSAHSANTDAGNFLLFFNSADKIDATTWTFQGYLTSSVYRDPASLYNVVFAVDTDNATANNRWRLYVNGVEVTALSVRNNPALNLDMVINSASVHELARYNSLASYYFDGNLGETVIIDGQQLDPTSFGEFDDNGVWRPIDVSGLTFGTNGFYLNSADGVDQSGNSNNWTPVNTPTDSLDTPTTIYATFNPVGQPGSNAVLTNGALSHSSITTGGHGSIATVFVSSGTWVSEFHPSSNSYAVGVCNTAALATALVGTGAYVYIGNSGAYVASGSSSAYGTTYTSPNVVRIELDLDNLTLEFFVDGSSQGQKSIPAGAYTFCVARDGSNSHTGTINFGATAWAGTPTTGFLALNSANLYANDPPAIPDGTAHFQTALHTGTGSAITINQTGNSTFTPDFVWTKGRSGATDHILSDILQGTGKYWVTNTALSQATDAQALTAFGAGSISYGTLAAANTNAATYVDWMWKANAAGVANADGSISSTVSANTTAGISLVKWTTTGANGTVGHGLGAPIGMIIFEELGTNDSHLVWHRSLTAGGRRLFINGLGAESFNADNFNSTDPTSTVFSVSIDNPNLGGTSLAICFAEIPGFSKFSAYTGNGSADGPFVYTGFKPAWVLFKNASVGSHWLIYDTARDTYNVMTLDLSPNAASAEPAVAGTAMVDYTSNGFKIRSTNANTNGSGNKIIYAAFASVPSFGETPAKAR